MAKDRYNRHQPSGELEYDLQIVQDELERLFDRLVSDDYGKVTLKDLDLEVGFQNIVSHGLGKRVVGYRVIKKDGFGDVAFVSSDNQNLVLKTTAAVNIDLEVWH